MKNTKRMGTRRVEHCRRAPKKKYCRKSHTSDFCHACLWIIFISFQWKKRNDDETKKKCIKMISFQIDFYLHLKFLSCFFRWWQKRKESEQQLQNVEMKSIRIEIFNITLKIKHGILKL